MTQASRNTKEYDTEVPYNNQLHATSLATLCNKAYVSLEF